MTRIYERAETVRYRRPRCAHCESLNVLRQRGILVNADLYVVCRECGKKTKCVEITDAQLSKLT